MTEQLVLIKGFIESIPALSLQELETLSEVRESLNKLEYRSLLEYFFANMRPPTFEIRKLWLFLNYDGVKLKEGKDNKKFLCIYKDWQQDDSYEHLITIVFIEDRPVNVLYETERYFYYDLAEHGEKTWGEFQGSSIDEAYKGREVYRNTIKRVITDIREIGKYLPLIQKTGRYLSM